MHSNHPAQVAGLFYPAEPDALRALIAEMRRGARPDGGVAPKVVVAPHAGVVYSGSVAATGFAPWTRNGGQPTRIVIVGPAHRIAFSGLAIHPASAWSTPLGEARVARDLHVRLAEARAAAVDSRPFAGEHSLEMHLVMLQAMLPAPFEILPILVGDATPAEVASALRLVWGGPETGIAISSDLSHFLAQAQRPRDRRRHGPADREPRRRLARRAAGLRLPSDRRRADYRRRARPPRQRAASGDVGRRRRGLLARGRLRRLRHGIRGVGAPRRRRPNPSALDRHGEPRRRGAERRRASRRSPSTVASRRRSRRCAEPS